MDKLSFLVYSFPTIFINIVFVYAVLRHKGIVNNVELTPQLIRAVFTAYFIDLALALSSISIIYGVLCFITNVPFDIIRNHAFETILASTLGTTALMCSKLDQTELSKI